MPSNNTSYSVNGLGCVFTIVGFAAILGALGWHPAQAFIHSLMSLFAK